MTVRRHDELGIKGRSPTSPPKPEFRPYVRRQTGMSDAEVAERLAAIRAKVARVAGLDTPAVPVARYEPSQVFAGRRPWTMIPPGLVERLVTPVPVVKPERRCRRCGYVRSRCDCRAR